MMAWMTGIRLAKVVALLSPMSCMPEARGGVSMLELCITSCTINCIDGQVELQGYMYIGEPHIRTTIETSNGGRPSLPREIAQCTYWSCDYLTHACDVDAPVV